MSCPAGTFPYAQVPYAQPPPARSAAAQYAIKPVGRHRRRARRVRAEVIHKNRFGDRGRDDAATREGREHGTGGCGKIAGVLDAIDLAGQRLYTDGDGVRVLRLEVDDEALAGVRESIGVDVRQRAGL